MRIVCRPKKGVRFEPLYRELRWLRVYDTIRYHSAITVDSIIRFCTPWDLADKFRRDYHILQGTKKTRVVQRLRVHHTSCYKRSRGFVVRASKSRSKLEEFMLDVQKIPRYCFKQYARSHYGGLTMPYKSQEFICNLLETDEDVSKEVKESMWEFVDQHWNDQEPPRWTNNAWSELN